MPDNYIEQERKKFPDMTERFKQLDARHERQRLEREIIMRAKEFTDDGEPRDNWNALAAYRELCRAVDALNEFESKR